MATKKRKKRSRGGGRAAKAPLSSPVPRTLAFAKPFQCGTCGLCCRDKHLIPITKDEVKRLSAALDSERFDAAVRVFAPDDHVGSATATFTRQADGACHFLTAENLCGLQLELGAEVLPGVCRTFPRNRVQIGRDHVYGLSYKCPTALRLLATEDQCFVVENPQFSLDLYSMTAEHLARPPQTLGLTRRRLSLAGYALMKEHLVASMADPAVDVDAALIRAGMFLQRVADLPVSKRSSVKDMEELVVSDAAFDAGRLEKQLEGQRGGTAGLLVLMGAWLRLLGQLGNLSDPEILSLIAKYEGQALGAEEQGTITSIYWDRVAPVMSQNHWVLRNYLAQRFYVDFHAVALDHFDLGFFWAFFSLGLIKLILAERALRGQALSLTDVLEAVGVADEYSIANFHTRQRLALVIQEQSWHAGEFLGWIRLDPPKK